MRRASNLERLFGGAAKQYLSVLERKGEAAEKKKLFALKEREVASQEKLAESLIATRAGQLELGGQELGYRYAALAQAQGQFESSLKSDEERTKERRSFQAWLTTGGWQHEANMARIMSNLRFDEKKRTWEFIEKPQWEKQMDLAERRIGISEAELDLSQKKFGWEQQVTREQMDFAQESFDKNYALHGDELAARREATAATVAIANMNESGRWMMAQNELWAESLVSNGVKFNDYEKEMFGGLKFTALYAAADPGNENLSEIFMGYASECKKIGAKHGVNFPYDTEMTKEGFLRPSELKIKGSKGEKEEMGVLGPAPTSAPSPSPQSLWRQRPYQAPAQVVPTEGGYEAAVPKRSVAEYADSIKDIVTVPLSPKQREIIKRDGYDPDEVENALKPKPTTTP